VQKKFNSLFRHFLNFGAILIRANFGAKSTHICNTVTRYLKHSVTRLTLTLTDMRRLVVFEEINI